MSFIVHAANVLNLICPVRETIGLRRWFYRLGGIEIGKGTRITHGVTFYDRHITIGRNVWIGMSTRFASSAKARIVVGDNVDIAPCCCIVSGTHELGTEERRAGRGAGADVRIGAGTWVGAGSRILPGANIGASSVVAAGSVVISGNYPANSLLAGVPARVKKRFPTAVQLT